MQAFLKNRVARNASWMILCKAAEALLGLAVSMIVARYLQPELYGLLSYAASLVTFVTPVALLGFHATLVQELVEHPEEEGQILGSAILSSLLSSLICLLGILLFIRLSSPGEKLTLLVCGLYSLMLLMQSLELIQYWFHAKLLSKYASLFTLIAYFLICVYQLMLVVTKQSLLWFALSKAFEYILISAGLYITYRRLGGSRLAFSLKKAAEMFGRSKHFMISMLLVMTYAQADRVMIKMMIGSEAMGYYSAAVVCANLTEFVFLAIIDSFRPAILEEKKRDSVQYGRVISMLYSLVIVLSLAQSVFITALARPMVLLLYGEAYLPSVPALRVIVWYTAFSYIGTIRNIWLLAENKQRYLWMINLCGAACNILLNFLLIPVWGITGAALTSLVTQILTNVVTGFLFKPLREHNRLLLASLNLSASWSCLRERLGTKNIKESSR